MEDSGIQPVKRSFILRGILLIIIFGSLLATWEILRSPNLFPIKDVEIGAPYQHIESLGIKQAVTSYIKGNFFSLNVARLSSEIVKMPWVYSANITRVWPDKIVIEIAEQQAIARWNDDGLLNTNADIFFPPKSTFPDNLPLFRGPDAQAKEVWAHYVAMNKLLAELNLQITELDYDQQEAWRLMLSNGISVLLGNDDPMDKLALFVQLYPKIIGDKSDLVEAADTRYNNGLSIKWK